MQIYGLHLLCLQLWTLRSLRKQMRLVLCYTPITLRSGEENERRGAVTSGRMLFWDHTVNGGTIFTMLLVFEDEPSMQLLRAVQTMRHIH